MMHGKCKEVQACECAGTTAETQVSNPFRHARAKEERIFMAFSTAGGGPSRPEMNVTPLIDILLVLIIVFMVIVATSKDYVVNT